MWAPFGTRAICDCTGHIPVKLADGELGKGLTGKMNVALFRMRKKALGLGGWGGEQRR